MDPYSQLVEQRLQDAERAGAFRDLPGSGRPLALEDLSNVPDELRTSYILLRSQGYVPPELEARKEWLRLEDLIAACVDPEDRARLRDGAARARERYHALLEQRAPRLRLSAYSDLR